MNNQMQIFENEAFGKLRVLEIEGEPWFVGRDVAELLGYADVIIGIKPAKLDKHWISTTFIPLCNLYFRHFLMRRS